MTAPTVQFTSEPILFGPGVTTVAKRAVLFIDPDDRDVLEGYVAHNVPWSDWDEGTIGAGSVTGWIEVGEPDKTEG